MQQPAGWPRERVAHLKMPSPMAVAGPCDGPQALSLRHLVQRIGHGSKPRHGFGAIGQQYQGTQYLFHIGGDWK